MQPELIIFWLEDKKLKLVKNAKVIPREECIPQHKLFVAVLKI